MKQKCLLWAVLALFIVGSLTVCTSGPKSSDEKSSSQKSSGPPDFEKNQPTDLQQEINKIAEEYPVPLAGKDLVVKYAGDAWLGTLDGKNAMTGTCAFELIENGAKITITPTHAWSSEQKPVVGGDIGWIGSPVTTSVSLIYNEGPPASLTVMADASIDASTDTNIE